MKIRQIGFDDAAQERDRVRQQEAERDAKERAMSSKDREKEVAARNAERKQEREAATQALQAGNVNLQEIARQGGSLGRRIEREVRRFEQTGRVSGWLAGETIKAEAAQNAAQQSAFRQAVVDVIQSSPSGSFDLVPAKPNIELVTRKPDVTEEGTGGEGGSIAPHPWQILLRIENNTNQYKVDSASRLYKGLGDWDNVTVSGLGTWQSASSGYVVLRGVVANGICSSASIAIESSLPERIEFSDDDQTSFATQLGFLFQEGESLLVRQNAFHNFTLITSCVNGKAAIYPIAT
jgi:hypothetical protein